MLRRNYSSDRSRSRERSPTPRRYGNRQYNSPITQVQGLGVGLIQEWQQTEIELDVLDAGSMIILQMNAQTQVLMIQMGMNQIVQHCN